MSCSLRRCGGEGAPASLLISLGGRFACDEKGGDEERDEVVVDGRPLTTSANDRCC